jgi:hypothetical protein
MMPFFIVLILISIKLIKIINYSLNHLSNMFIKVINKIIISLGNSSINNKGNVNVKKYLFNHPTLTK